MKLNKREYLYNQNRYYIKKDVVRKKCLKKRMGLRSKAKNPTSQYLTTTTRIFFVRKRILSKKEDTCAKYEGGLLLLFFFQKRDIR